MTLSFAFPAPAEASPIPKPEPAIDIIIGKQLTIERELLQPLQNKDFKSYTPLEPVAPPTPVKTAVKTHTRGIGGANTYVAGQCTWYAKSKRMDLPSNLGNANQWLANAQAQGLATGSSPQAGAVGVSFEGYYGHVVYIERVNPDGSVFLSEMNYRGSGGGPGIVSTRNAPASQFKYIY